MKLKHEVGYLIALSPGYSASNPSQSCQAQLNVPGELKSPGVGKLLRRKNAAVKSIKPLLLTALESVALSASLPGQLSMLLLGLGHRMNQAVLGLSSLTSCQLQASWFVTGRKVSCWLSDVPGQELVSNAATFMCGRMSELSSHYIPKLKLVKSYCALLEVYGKSTAPNTWKPGKHTLGNGKSAMVNS
jgi:hypothetical protein